MNYKAVIFFAAICQSIYCVEEEKIHADDFVGENGGMPPNVDQASKISFESPKMSDEEQFSAHLPAGFKCDACTAIAFQMSKQLKKGEKNGKRMKESDYLDVFENICGVKTWESYGLKSMNGVNRISGEGLEANEHPGMMYGGGKWPPRLSSKCFELTGEYGEDELYDGYRQNKNDFKMFLCQQLTNDCKAGNGKKKVEL